MAWTFAQFLGIVDMPRTVLLKDYHVANET